MSGIREYFIKKRGLYYMPNSRGYTDRPILAGLYTLEEARDITHPNGEHGPRDGMAYFHERDCGDDDYVQFKALKAKLDAAVEALKVTAAAWRTTNLSNGSIRNAQSMIDDALALINKETGNEHG